MSRKRKHVICKGVGHPSPSIPGSTTPVSAPGSTVPVQQPTPVSVPGSTVPVQQPTPVSVPGSTAVVMKTGIVWRTSTLSQTELIGDMTGKKSKIPIYASDYKREYLFIRGLNSYFKCFSKKLDCINHGLFESNISNIIKKYMKRFLRAQEKGKFNNINNLIIPSYDIDIIRDMLFINENFELYKIRYDFFCDNGNDDYDNDNGEYFVDGKPYPGFKEFYDIFKMILNQINYRDYNYYNIDSDSDSNSDSDSDFSIYSRE